MILHESMTERGVTIDPKLVEPLLGDPEMLLDIHCYGKLLFDSDAVKYDPPVDTASFDQLHQPESLVEADFLNPDWKQVINELKEKGVEAILPASENGVRQLAITKLASASEINLLQVSGGDRELKWYDYVETTSDPDPIEFQKLATRSKFARFYREWFYGPPESELVEQMNGFTNVITVGFDTLVYLWDATKERYVPREKPKNEQEALATIFDIGSGVPFLVSTVCLVDKFSMKESRTGFATTLIPARMDVHSSNERGVLIDHLMKRYRMIRDLDDLPWKMTPAGASLMHPEVQKYLKVGINNSLRGNVNTGGFSRMIWPTPRNGQREGMGDLAIKDHVEQQIAKPHQYVFMSELPVGLRERVGMVFSGYSEKGMLQALRQYSNSKGYPVNPILFRKRVNAFHEQSSV